MTLPPLAANAWLRWDVTRRLVPAQARTVLEAAVGAVRLVHPDTRTPEEPR